MNCSLSLLVTFFFMSVFSPLCAHSTLYVPDQTYITGTYSLNSPLIMEIGGTSMNEYDRLIVASWGKLVTNDQPLNITFIDPDGAGVKPVYMPQAAASFDLFDWNGQLSVNRL